METKFTPGPWEALPQNGAGPMIVHRFETGNQMQPTGLRLIAHMLARGNSLQQDQANARLIAAAPTMADYIRIRAADGDAEAMKIWESINGAS